MNTAFRFRWTCSYMGTVDYEITDHTGTYGAELRRSVSDYELSIANGDDVRREMLSAVGILRRRGSNGPDYTFAIPQETVDAFNAWCLAQHRASIAKIEADPHRYGDLPANDPLRTQPMIARRGWFADGRWHTADDTAAAA